jgi:hypothetical protein
MCCRSAGHSRVIASLPDLVPKQARRTMRAYLETIAMIIGLLGIYFALVPLVA